LGFVNYHRTFIKDLSRIAAPFNLIPYYRNRSNTFSKFSKWDSKSFPITNMSSKNARTMSHVRKLDANSAYYQVKMKEEDKQKTAFITKYGLFQFWSTLSMEPQFWISP
jgi:adenine C2-methylase RlmN of 23S rRNA A2503 and tRNA A37